MLFLYYFYIIFISFLYTDPSICGLQHPSPPQKQQAQLSKKGKRIYLCLAALPVSNEAPQLIMDQISHETKFVSIEKIVESMYK